MRIDNHGELFWIRNEIIEDEKRFSAWLSTFFTADLFFWEVLRFGNFTLLEVSI